ncbi:hypothetical protein PFBG_06122 [Plasmodium falciparum 7G8]|uniref:Surface antigen n=2 Tax=Plasmodium falciparum TaxID=5833 RepID=A0A024UY70_PLAFA|nr:hypothetical protein PFFVO_06117 [Plasmodium falciparum Vietnam Oak-Knoll (FVO)]EUR49171.1 hypothetical protein PFBG_06122 [Plasmodium falciparum 7G8]
MKVHYINVLLFALPLNILEYNQRNHKSATFHTSNTKPTKTHRTLCECESYAPSNYENDPEMKELIENFNDQTSERFREYDERMQDKRKQCKEQCEKDIQKIILKDKIEKELTEKFATLGTNIDTNDIPTCVCEKSLADKTEKVCLNCGKTMGAVAPAWGLISGLGYAAWTHYVATKVFEAGITEGIKVAIEEIKTIYLLGNIPGINFAKLVTTENFNNINLLGHAVQNVSTTTCQSEFMKNTAMFCGVAEYKPSVFAKGVAQFARTAAQKADEAAKAAELAEASKFIPKTTILTNTIIASIVAIVVIVLVMVIIYLILRYRRKKKINKKLQYIKLLEE